MNRLPTEILNQIFILSHQRQKVELMSVCRHWAYIIEKYILYDTIIIHSRDRFRNLIQKLRMNQQQSSILTHCLILETDLGTDFDLLSLLFPNVRVIYLGKKIRVDVKKLLRFDRIVHIHESCRKSNGGDSTLMTIDSSLDSTVNSNSSLWLTNSSEDEDDEDDDEDDDTDQSQSSSRRRRLRRRYIRIKSKNITSQLLSSNHCPHLRTLAVSIYPISGKDFIRLLINAPNLTQLTLNEFTITFERLELLHSTLPCLKKFSVLEGGVALVDKILPDAIQPAQLVTHLFFKIYRGRILMKTRFLQYLKLKYTNLYEFSFYNIFNRENHFGLTSSSSSSSSSQQQQEQSSNTPHFFKDGLIPLLSGLGSQLKRLTLRVPLLDPNKLMIGLKNSNYQLDYLGLETSYSTDIIKQCTPVLKPFGNLRSLCLQDPESDNFDYLKELKHLRQLQIYHPSPEQFNIHDLLDMCNDQLDSLSLGDCWLMTDLLLLNNYRLYSLKELRLTRVTLSQQIDTFLGLFLPDLKSIVLNDCHFQDNDFCLPGHHLFNLTITDHSFCTTTINDYILVKTLDIHHRKVYAISQPGRRQTFFDQGPAFAANKHQTCRCFLAFGPHVVFTFASVRNILVSTPGSGYSRPISSPSIHFL